MKKLKALAGSDRSALEGVYRGGSTHRERQRTQAILRSSRGYSLDELAEILPSDRDTASRWLSRWEKEGLSGGLTDAPRAGRPHKMDAVAAAVRDILENPSPNLKAVVTTELEKGLSLSSQMVRRTLRRWGYSSRRARRAFRPERHHWSSSLAWFGP